MSLTGVPMNRARFEVHNSPKFLPYFCAPSFVTFCALMGLRIVKSFRFLAFLIVWACVTTLAAAFPVPASAQSNIPFKNPSLDSNCYFPQIDDPSEMDTVVGTPGQLLGHSALKNLGPRPDGGYGNMLIGNLSPSVSLAQVETGPTFNLHKLKSHTQNFNPSLLSGGYILAHLRDTKHLDLFNGRIYWADDEGNYDSSRYTVLKENIPLGPFGRIEGGPFLPWYVAHLTSDTVDDIIATAYTEYTNENLDSSYALLWRGGARLYGRDTVAEDTSAFIYVYGHNALPRQCLQADFRGVGRDDLIVSNYGTLWYYKNDPPFDLRTFIQEVTMDTIFKESLLGQSDNAVPPQYFAMRVIPKPGSAVDLLAPGAAQDTGATGNPSIWIFRGGPDFGSHRLTLDSATFVIPHPQFNFGSSPYSDWALFAPQDAGDMTGTGNHVLLVEASDDLGDTWWDNFYVTGKALDDKIDMWNVATSAGGGDTLTANPDSLEDFIESRARDDLTDSDPGTMWLYYGTKQIPVHLNPQWAEVQTEIDEISQKDGAGISFSPNPVTQSWSVATIIWPEAEEAEYAVFDMLGRRVEQGPIRLLGGAEEQRIYFSGVGQGTYIFTIESAKHSASTRLVKLSEGGAASGSQPNVIQQMKQMRGGGTVPLTPASEILR